MAEQTTSSKRHYDKYKQAGRCVRCGSPDLVTQTLCQVHREKLRQYKLRDDYSERRKELRAQKIAAGICPLCSGPLDDGKTACRSCRAGIRQAYQQRKQDRCCVGCGKPLKPERIVITCEMCSLKQYAMNWLNSTTRWKELQDLLMIQKYACIYTGEPLVVGENASLDHIKPRSRFPELQYDIENLQWVTKSVNWMKRNLTHKEFVAIARKIVDAASKR